MRLKNVLAPVLAAGLFLFAAPAFAHSVEGGPTPAVAKAKNTFLDKALDRVSFSGMLQAGYSQSFGPGTLVHGFLGNGSSDFNVHRLILVAKARVTDRLEVTYNGNFANGYTNLEYYATYTVAPEFAITFGQKKIPLLMENQISPATHELLADGTFISNYMEGGDNSNPLMGVWSGRDFGLEVKGDLFGRVLGYRLGVYNGQGMNQRDRNKNKALTGSLSVRPFKGMEVTGTFYTGKGKAAGNALFEGENGRVMAGDEFQMDRFSGGLSYQSKRFGIRSEYVFGREGDVLSDGAYATMRIGALKNFDIVASYAYGNFNKTLDSRYIIHNYIAGLQYWFLPKCRLSVEYNVMDPAGPVEANHTINTQLQFAF